MRTTFKASKVTIDSNEKTVKFNKSVQHGDDISKPDAIRESVDKKLSKLDVKVIGMTSMGYTDDVHKYMFHIGNKDDGVWMKRGQMMVSFS
tara:strand:+ start:3736 stop:4008 length:273 start_codon:yes stop_codon:yes gene_type:complete